jgi:hypothetical protein
VTRDRTPAGQPAEARWHHIVPKFLVRRFSEDPRKKDAVVHWYDVITGEYGVSAPRDTAVVEDFNTLRELGVDALAFERIQSQIEGRAAQAMVAMAKGEPFKVAEQVAVARLIVMQHHRSPRTRQWQSDLRAAMAGVDLQMNVPQLPDGRSPEDRRWWEESGLEALRRGDDAAVANASPRAAEVVGQFIADDAVPLILATSFRWTALEAPVGLDFVLSDHPVHLHDPESPVGGIGVAWRSSATVQVTLPIDPSCILLLSEADVTAELTKFGGAAGVMELNLRQYASAETLLFGRSEEALRRVVALAHEVPELVDYYRPRPLRFSLEPSSANPGKFTMIINGDPMLPTVKRPLRNDSVSSTVQ